MARAGTVTGMQGTTTPPGPPVTAARTAASSARGPKMAAADKAAVLRALRQLAGNATYHGAKGMVAVVALCLEEHSGSGVTALRRRLEDRVAAQWDAKMAGWQKQLGMVTQLGLQGATPQAVKAKAATIMDSLPRATAAAVLQAAAGAAEGGEKGSTMTGLKRSSTQRPCAVGRREYLHVNVPDERTTARAESVTTWQPPRVHRTARAVDDLPGREARYLPTTAAQRGQLRTLQAYQVDRVPEHLGASDAVFAVGTMMKAVGACPRTGGWFCMRCSRRRTPIRMWWRSGARSR